MQPALALYSWYFVQKFTESGEPLLLPGAINLLHAKSTYWRADAAPEHFLEFSNTQDLGVEILSHVPRTSDSPETSKPARGFPGGVMFLYI